MVLPGIEGRVGEYGTDFWVDQEREIFDPLQGGMYLICFYCNLVSEVTPVIAEEKFLEEFLERDKDN